MENNFGKYKIKLEKEKAKLLGDVAKAERPEDFGDDVDDADEEKNEAESLGNQLAFIQTIKMRISDIDAALNKIIGGTYGVCEKCGGKIESEVLDVSPESRLCKKCKKGA